METKYKLDGMRLLNLWILPILFLIFVFAAFHFKYGSIFRLQLTSVIALIFFIIITTGVFIFLFLNHLPLAKQTELTIIGSAIVKEIQIVQGTVAYTIPFGEIEEVIEYSTAGLPWSAIVKWKIIAKGNQIIISSLCISRRNFERYFFNRITSKPDLFPAL